MLIFTEIEQPSLTVAIPAYNEVKNIERLISGFLATGYQNLVEIFVADGGSTDGTQDIVRQLAAEDPRVKLLHNPAKFQSAGLNLILEQCTGELFLRADAHSDYASDYIEQCVIASRQSRALNVGGAQRFVAKNALQGGIALSAMTFFGNGGAKYRNPNYDGYADTVYLGCFWRQDLLAISGYSTQAIINEDAELNLRLRSYYQSYYLTNQDIADQLISTDECVYVSSKINVCYYPRPNWKALVIQYFKYGGGRCITASKYDTRLQIRGMLPFISISTVIGSGLASGVIPELRYPLVLLLALVFGLICVESLQVCWKYRSRFSTDIWRGDSDTIPSFIDLYLRCVLVTITLPCAHFCGYGYQLLGLLNSDSNRNFDKTTKQT
jgi:succinoglycan biosynthesis protein ExoA